MRVAVIVRAPAGWLWWPGILAAGIGTLPPGLTGRRIGLLTGAARFRLPGAALFLLAAPAVLGVRRGRYLTLAQEATRAGKSVFLQDRAVTLRARRRALRWWLLLAFLAAVASSFAV